MSAKQRKLPLYEQIKNKMLMKINHGDWTPGENIPSESQLMERFNVSRTTIRQALRDLAHQGIIETRRGAPSRVSISPKGKPRSQGVFHHEMGNEMTVKVLRTGVVTNYEALRRLNLGKSEQVFFLERLRLADRKPIAYQQLFLPFEIGKVVKDYAEIEFDIFPKLGREDIHYSTIKEQVNAAVATQYEADLLGIFPGEPLVDIDRLTLGIEGSPIEYSRTKYRTDSFHYKVEIGG
ncbi:GntR family transcriptional regulator [Halobacillus salinarum]|uniref:GntR family transcriptional regulator n=1 Tax=Halobacillus salinarum TaxID=2932257 RepID=A0ABY4EP51_9BACI|nr:GntR family transcriptional regulator [Halobacillus salinarum]UOQ45979.1 GntR family transcriptional regulator [Halobacillus salinarum]